MTRSHRSPASSS